MDGLKFTLPIPSSPQLQIGKFVIETITINYNFDLAKYIVL